MSVFALQHVKNYHHGDFYLHQQTVILVQPCKQSEEPRNNRQASATPMPRQHQISTESCMLVYESLSIAAAACSGGPPSQSRLRVWYLYTAVPLLGFA